MKAGADVVRVQRIAVEQQQWALRSHADVRVGRRPVEDRALDLNRTTVKMSLNKALSPYQYSQVLAESAYAHMRRE